MWALRPLGVLGSPPLPVSDKVECRQPATLASGRQRGTGVPSPGCLAQALTGQGPSYEHHRLSSGRLPDYLYLFWQARLRQAASPAKPGPAAGHQESA